MTGRDGVGVTHLSSLAMPRKQRNLTLCSPMVLSDCVCCENGEGGREGEREGGRERGREGGRE